jgi:uncharacterized metal-binding protein
MDEDPRFGALERIAWIDSHARTEWTRFEEALEWAKTVSLDCLSVGWVIFEDEYRLVLCSHRFGPSKSVDGTWVIPKVAIVERVRLDVLKEE